MERIGDGKGLNYSSWPILCTSQLKSRLLIFDFSNRRPFYGLLLQWIHIFIKGWVKHKTKKIVQRKIIRPNHNTFQQLAVDLRFFLSFVWVCILPSRCISIIFVFGLLSHCCTMYTHIYFLVGREYEHLSPKYYYACNMRVPKLHLF